MASEIRVTNIKANDGTASLTVANSSGAVTTGQNLAVGGTLTSTGAITASGGIANAGTLSAGTIGDNVNTTNKYYLQLKCGSNHVESDGDAYIRTTDSTAPYFVQTGDTTNLLATDTTNIKVLRKGVYLVTFSVTLYKYSAQSSAQITAQIHGGTSVNPTSVLAIAQSNLASISDVEPDYGNVVAIYIGELSANYYLRFHVKSLYTTNMTISSDTHASICLLRPTA